MAYLPHPRTRGEIRQLLEQIDERLLGCTEKFIELQVRQPTQRLVAGSPQHHAAESPEGEWLNIYSIYRSNQQLNEACNKLWATAELIQATSPESARKGRSLVGELFDRNFLQGTLIPTLYYSQISAMMSMLSSFAFIFFMTDGRRYILVRTQDGWKIFKRDHYVRKFLRRTARGWHQQVIESYEGLRRRRIALPRLAIKKIHRLRQVRNAMHYEILGDLRMWRMIDGVKLYNRYLPTVVRSIRLGIENLSTIKTITTGCGVRFKNLVENLRNADLV